MSKSDLLDAARKNQLAAIIAEAFAPPEQDPTTSSGARPTSSLRVVPRPAATRLGCASKGMKGKNDSRTVSKKVVKQQQQTKQATPSSSKPLTATSGATPRPGSRTPDALPEQQQDDDAQLVFDVRQTLDGIEDMDEAVVALRTLCRSRLENTEVQEDSDENNNSGSGDDDDTEGAHEESFNPTGGTSPLSEEHSEGSSRRHRDPEQGDEEDSDQPEADGMGADGKDKDGVGLEILDLTAEQCRELREEQDQIDAELEEEGEDLYLTTTQGTSSPRRHDGQDEEERPTCVSPTRGHVKPAVESTPLAMGTRGAEDPTFRLLPRPPKPLVEAESLPKPGVLRSHIHAGASASQAGGESATSSEEVSVELVPSGLPGFYQWRCQGCRSMNSVPEWVGKYVSPDSPLKGVAGKGGGAGGDASRTVQLSQDEALMLKCPLCDTTPK